MQRMDRSSHSPLGAIVFVVLGLTVIPVSLRVAGVGAVSPRLAAAIDAWQQITQVFGASYQAASDPQQAPERLNLEEPNPNERQECTNREPAYAGHTEDVTVTTLAVAQKKSVNSRARCSKSTRSIKGLKTVESSFSWTATGEDAGRGSDTLFDRLVPARMETLLHQSFDKNGANSFGLSCAPSVGIKNLPLPASVRLIIRMSPAALDRTPRTSESKGWASVAREHRSERERVRLINPPADSPENSEM